jgi:hypothetical protein
MQFKDEKKEGTIEFDGIKDPGMGRRATFKLTLVKPSEAVGYFEASDIKWDVKTKKAVGLRTYNKDIVQAFGFKWGQEICLTMPDEMINFILQINEDAKEQIKHDKINQDFEYKLYDTDTYGIYNGINESHITELIGDVKRQLNADVFLFADDIKRILNKDVELKTIAVETYIPYPEHENWNEETKRIYRENVAIKRASGYGIIPNKIMREKITKIIEAEVEKENAEKRNEEGRVNKLFEVAKETGEPQIISEGTVPCPDKHEECSCDIVQVLAMPDGTKQVNQYHTW